MWSAANIVKLTITSLSIVDFVVFSGLFLVYMFVVKIKSKTYETLIGSILVSLFFVVFKIMHIPIFLSTIPPLNVNIPKNLEYVVISILTFTNIILGALPLLCAIYTLIKQTFQKTKKLENIKKVKINVIMPIYNEDSEALWNAINSVYNLDYPKELIDLYLSFDGRDLSDAYMYLLEKWALMTRYEQNGRLVIDLEGMLIHIMRSEHGGKKHAQKTALDQIEMDQTQESLKDSLIFFIDSDIILHKNCLNSFILYMNTYNKTCATGLITCTVKNTSNPLVYYQDVEYVSGQIYWRNFESKWGFSCSCLPGAFTILKYTALKGVSEKYFQFGEFGDTFDYHRFYLGEDRYLTHLLMLSEKHKIGYCDTALCKTEAPTNFSQLIKQRKRWYLGHLSNDTWMLSSLQLWWNYPVMFIFNLVNNSRNTSVYIYLLYFVLALNKETPFLLWFLFIIVPLVLNWLFLVLYAIKLKRKMNILMYLGIICLQPIMSTVYMYYSIVWFRQRSWGGIRVERVEAQIIDAPLQK